MTTQNEQRLAPDGRPQKISRWIDREILLSMHLPAISMGFGMGATTVVLPELTKTNFEQTFVAAMMVFILQQIGTAVAPIPTGFMIDRIGRRKMLLAGPFIVGISSLLMAQAAVWGTFEQILIYQFFSGIGQQMWMLSRITVIADTGGAQQRGKQITSMFGVTQVGTLLGPVVGGLTAVWWGIWVPFVIHGVIVMLAVIPSFYLVKETLAARTPPAQAGGAPAPRRGLSKQDLRTPPILQVFIVQFLANVTRGGIFGGGVIMIYASFQYDMSTSAIGGLRSSLALFGIVVTFVAGYVMDKYGRKYTIVPGLILSGLAMVFLALTDFFDMPIEIFVGAFVAIHLAVSIISGNMQTLSTDVAPAHARGAFFGVSRQVAQVGSLSSPVSFTILVQLISYGVAFSFLASTALVGGVIMLFLIPETLVKEDATPAVPEGSTQATPSFKRPPT